MSGIKNELLFDVGSTYFKVYEGGRVRHHFRDFSRPIYEDLLAKCGDLIRETPPEAIRICSSANGGLSTLIIGVSTSFSLRYAVNIAFNSGINIIDTLLWSQIDTATPPMDLIDVVIVVGGIDGVERIFNERLPAFLEGVRHSNLVYVGSLEEREALREWFPGAVILDNIIDEKLRIREGGLKHYLTDLYQADIVGKEEIKRLYEITANQIFSTPYVVNRALPRVRERMEVADPFILIDIGGATTDIHYSRDLAGDNLTGEGGYDRLVFKKLGVYKSRESLVHTARQNEFTFELLEHLGVTEDILDSKEEAATRVLMQLAIFLVLFKVSRHHADYVELNLERLNTILLTGGISKVLTDEEVEAVVRFFYLKLLHFEKIPTCVIDRNYEVWTYGMQALEEGS